MNVSCWIYPAVVCISPSIGTSQADPKLPSAVVDLMARLDRAPRLREVAQLGSVLGREFAYDMISALAGLERRAGVGCRGAVAHRLSR